jgi:hypothetical protein
MTFSESKQLKADYQARFGNYEIQVSKLASQLVSPIRDWTPYVGLSKVQP